MILDSKKLLKSLLNWKIFLNFIHLFQILSKRNIILENQFSAKRSFSLLKNLRQLWSIRLEQA